jgi:predicted ArsR family transcriptional regulator
MSELKSSQDKILYQIKRLGPQSVKSLAAILEISTMGVRQHLKLLNDEGLITILPEEPQARGRPVSPWKLTEKGHARFPDGHAQITADLILSVREVLGETALDKIMEKRTLETYQQYHASMDELELTRDKAAELVRLRTNEGYMAELIEHDGDLLILEHHCPICIAAKTCQGFCRSELEVFQKLFQGKASVVREDHILNGARRCSYRISPNDRNSLRSTH